MGAKEHPSEALVCPRRRPRVRAAPALWGVCSCREGFVTMGVSSSHSPLLCCATDTSENTIYSDFSVLAPLPPELPAGARWTPHAAHGAGGESSGPHLGPLPARRTAEANAVKPKKLLRRLQGRLACVCPRQLQWKPAPEVLCLAPPGQVPGFPCGLPGGGTGAVIRTGLPALACRHTHAHTHHVPGPCPHSGPSSCALGSSSQPWRRERQWQLLPAEVPPALTCTPRLGLSTHTGTADRASQAVRAGGT